MLSKKDIALLRGMFDEVLVTRLDARDVQWDMNLDQRFHDFRLDILDEFVFPLAELQVDMVRVKDRLQMA